MSHKSLIFIAFYFKQINILFQGTHSLSINLGMDHQQQFCLKWNSFGSNLATAFGNLYKSESLADVTLFCEGKFLFV